MEWLHVAIASGSLLVGIAGGLIAGTWKVARSVAKVEIELRREIYERLTEIIKERDEKLEDLAHQFEETLKALRQKINDVELYSVKNFVAKHDFDDFRAEYREDMRDLKKSISEISR